MTEGLPIFAVDPGTTNSSFVIFDGARVRRFGELENNAMALEMRAGTFDSFDWAIEMVASYGMAVGREVFETVFWIGRFYEIGLKNNPRRIYRQEVKLHLCGSVRAKDANVNQALRDRFGGNKASRGTKAAPGPLYGISEHRWAALAVAVYTADHPEA